MIRAGIKKNECEMCGYIQTRPDGRGPMLLHCKDGNIRNLLLDNLEVRCYNCTFITTGRVDSRFLLTPNPVALQRDFQERLKETPIDIEQLQREIQDEFNSDES
jgi:hypothetical protein